MKQMKTVKLEVDINDSSVGTVGLISRTKPQVYFVAKSNSLGNPLVGKLEK